MNKREASALISDIQLFSTADGPGIRTTIFFKGCNLRCAWCHNPETIGNKPQILYYSSLCIGCGACETLCPRHAHHLTESGHTIDRTVCTACGLCTACPRQALLLSGRQMTVSEVFDAIRADKEFYDQSGGGVTLSGGEPLLQAPFCAALAEVCKETGISVLIETAANLPFTAFEQVLPYTFEYYVDLKGGTEEGYRYYTGGSLERTLENMARLVRAGASVTARIPVIPGHNDTPESSLQMAAALKPTGVKTVHLLPFHKLCTGKYQALGLDYSYKDSSPPDRNHLQTLADLFKDDFDVSIQD